jgi:flagellar biosynthetic protein FliR
MEILVVHLVVYLLLFIRCTAVVATAPVIGHIAVPVQVKVAAGLFLGFVLFPMVSARAPQVDVRLLALALMALQEAVVGLLIGFGAGMIFSGVRSAGELIGFEMGFSIANVFDPEAGLNNVLGTLLQLGTMLVFLMVNGHHFVIQALLVSYESVPFGGFAMHGELAPLMIGLTGTLFVVAVKLAAPVIVASFLMNVALAILSRVAPQVNVFIMSFPMKVGVGFLVLMACSPLLIYVFKQMLAGLENQLLQIVRAL